MMSETRGTPDSALAWIHGSRILSKRTALGHTQIARYSGREWFTEKPSHTVTH
jgi:hypothetical protein